MLMPDMAARACPQGSQPCPCLEAILHYTRLPAKFHAGGALGQELFSTGNSAKKQSVPDRHPRINQFQPAVTSHKENIGDFGGL